MKRSSSLRSLLLLSLLLLGGAGAFHLLTAAPAFASDGLVLKKFFTDSGLPGNWVKGIFRDGDRVVVTTMAGTAVGGSKGAPFAAFAPGDGFKGNSVTGWAEFGGKSYVGSDSALNIRDGGKWTSLEKHEQVQHAQELMYSDGKVLYALARHMYGGVLRFDGSKWVIVDRGPGTGIMNNATSILTRGNEIFIGTTTNGLFYFDGKAWKVIGQKEGLRGVWVTSLAANDQGVWVGGYNGLGLFDGERVKMIPSGDGLPSDRISALKVVKDKLVVGTMDKGAAILQGNRFVPVTAAQGLSDNRVEALEAADDGVWVGTVNGLNLVEVR